MKIRNQVIKYGPRKPADDLNAGGGDGGGAPTPEDRGDDFTPTPDPAPAPAPAADPAPAAAPAAADPAAPAADPAPASHMIPKERFDEVNNAMKAMRDELEAIKAAQQAAAKPAESAPPAVDPREALQSEYDAAAAALDDQLTEALFNGDKAAALAIQKQQRELSNKFLREEAKLLADTTYKANSQADRERAENEAAIARTIQRFPQLDAASASYDEAATAEVVALADAYVASGMSMVAALDKATSLFAKANGWADASAAPAASAQPTAAELLAKAAADRTAAARSATVAAVAAAAPPTSATGPVSTSVDPAAIAQMSQKEFDKLSEEERARLRGDFV